MASKNSTKNQKLVRDSFTIPKAEYAIIDLLKTRAIALGTSVKKSELLRAGLTMLKGLNDGAFKSALAAVPTLKTGRPSAQGKSATKASTKAAPPTPTAAIPAAPTAAKPVPPKASPTATKTTAKAAAPKAAVKTAAKPAAKAAPRKPALPAVKTPAKKAASKSKVAA
ncbi:hypothetical protein H010_01980 [Hydrogenophaga taeniospiralis CCUG 15921]|uniref:Uncharacterized protein n=1 Tax=Hydrogenophaga taeniospiralis CCUG 15921 TaxID=1281780 RepID=A0A9X4NMN4_9BURK|nr:hypothetical protein [Hydrogenophaga taeniospiralis]MDG5974003.1 hypothetical protein [Hydrogenophaga taeniospiralis CCUG 15921]